MTKGQKIGIGIVFGIPVVCGLGGWGVLNGIFGSSAAMRDSELAKAKRDGIPTTPEELSKLASVPDDQNALPVYREIVKEIGDQGPLAKDVNLVGLGLSSRSKPKDRDAAIQALGRLQHCLEVGRGAMKYRSVDFHRDWGLGAALLFPEFSAMKGLSKCYSLDAQVRSARGDWRGALDDLAVSERISQQVACEPTLIGMLVGVSIESVTDNALKQVINDHSHDAAFLEAAKKMHDDFGPLPDYRRAMSGEIVMGRTSLKQIQGFSEVSIGSPDRKPTGIERAIVQSRLVQGAWDARLTRDYRLLYEELPKDPANWEGSLKAAQDADIRASSETSLASKASQALMPVFSEAAVALGMEQARRNLIDSSLRLLLDRARTGKLPDYLPKYGASSVDPFSGNPLVYRRESSGFLLYSVGRDRVDNGGVEQWESKSGGYDEVIRVH